MQKNVKNLANSTFGAKAKAAILAGSLALSLVPAAAIAAPSQGGQPMGGQPGEQAIEQVQTGANDQSAGMNNAQQPTQGEQPPALPNGEQPTEGQEPPALPDGVEAPTDGQQQTDGQQPPALPNGQQPTEGEQPPALPEGVEAPAEGEEPPAKPEGEQANGDQKANGNQQANGQMPQFSSIEDLIEYFQGILDKLMSAKSSQTTSA